MDKATSLSLSLSELLLFPIAFCRIFIRTLHTLLTRWLQPNRRKSLYRLLTDTVTRCLAEELSISQMRYATGGSWDGYISWVKANKTQPVVDRLEDCRIFWIGKKKTTGRVILYCHGGAFITPLMSSMCTYWHKIQQEHEKVYGEEIGIAVLEYSLWPVSFPTQLLQLVQAVEHLVQTGIQPSELFLSGDSAGANLVLQFISHVLHPLPSLPQSTLTEPLAGMILLSPWISFTSSTPSHRSNAHFDICSTGTLSKWGSAYLEPIADGERIYAEPARAPPKWFSGMKEVVERMFITAGGSEVLRDDIGLLCETLSKVHPAVIFEMEENGVHNESIFGMMVGSTKSRVLGMIVEWLPGYLDRGRVANSVHRYK